MEDIDIRNNLDQIILRKQDDIFDDIVDASVGSDDIAASGNNTVIVGLNDDIDKKRILMLIRR